MDDLADQIVKSLLILLGGLEETKPLQEIVDTTRDKSKRRCDCGIIA